MDTVMELYCSVEGEETLELSDYQLIRKLIRVREGYFVVAKLHKVRNVNFACLFLTLHSSNRKQNVKGIVA